MRRLVVLVAGLLVAAGCAGPAGGSGAPLAGRTFLSTAVTADGKERPLAPGTRIRVKFADGQLTLHVGCNHLSGDYSLDGSALVVKGLGGTEMGCEAPLHEQDVWLSDFISARPSWHLSGDSLQLSVAGTTIDLVDREVADPDRPIYNTHWTVVSVIDGDVASSIPDDVEAFLIFREDGKVEGSTGCNQLTGSASVSGEKVTFGVVATTKMACGGSAGQLEAAVLRTLDGAVSARIEAAKLELISASGHGLQLRAPSS